MTPSVPAGSVGVNAYALDHAGPPTLEVTRGSSVTAITTHTEGPSPPRGLIGESKLADATASATTVSTIFGTPIVEPGHKGDGASSKDATRAERDSENGTSIGVAAARGAGRSSPGRWD